MIAISLQSGSNGNCIYVESNGAKLLFDAGISGIRAEQRLADCGRDIRQVDAVIISHDHADHVCCAGIYQRKFGLPIYGTRKTLDAASRRCDLDPLDDVRHFASGDVFQVGAVRIETIPTAHDAADGVAFVVDAGRKRLGIFTDLGHVFDGLDAVMGSLDAVFVESNYDPEMLATGPYPGFLKARIRGPRGHISNIESAELLRTSARKRLRWACLAHLSEQNNTPDLALKTHREISNATYPLYAASRYEPTGVLEV